MDRKSHRFAHSRSDRRRDDGNGQSMLTKLRELLWPVLDYGNEQTIQDKQKRHGEILQDIKKAKWQHQDVVLDEARRLVLREDERWKTTDTKATIYLAVLAAIVPLSLSFVKDISGYFGTFQDWQIIVLIALFLSAIVYLLAAGVWTFKTLGVSAHDRVDVEELLELCNTTDTTLTLNAKILKSAMNNRKCTNEKVNKLLMTHAFLWRTFVAFVLLVVYLGSITVYNYLNERWNVVT